MTSVRRAWVLMFLVGVAAWAANKPTAESPIDACVKARALSSSEHFKVCARLLPRCASALVSMDGSGSSSSSLSEVATPCAPAYCPRLTPAPRFCTGDLGSPSTNFAQEREFLWRALALEHDLRAKEASEAFLEPLKRLSQEAASARQLELQDVERNTRLRVRVSFEADQNVIRVLDHDGEEISRWSGVESPPPAQCERMIRDALKGKPARPEEHATIRAQKQVSFKVVKCTMSGLASAGFGKNLHFETWR